MTAATASMTAAPRIPSELAPSLVDRLRQLLAEVPPAEPRPRIVDAFRHDPRCVVCYRSGKLGGHHNADGEIEWIHCKCHRRLHRRGRGHGHFGARRRTAC